MFLYSLRYFYKHVLLDGLMLRAMDHIYTQSSSKLRAFSDTDVKKIKGVGLHVDTPAVPFTVVLLVDIFDLYFN